MTADAVKQDDDESADRGRRPPRAVVGSHRPEEEVFGKAYDPRIVRRIWGFVRPYQKQIYISIAAVLVFTLTQLAIPLIIRYAIDNGMVAGGDPAVLAWAVAAFGVMILINYGANWVQETVVGKAAENVLFDIRRAMFEHLQRVSLSFMDNTEVGRLMSRLSGDVNSMQEFLETSVLSVGDIVLLFGIVTVLCYLDWRLGLLTLSTMPMLFVFRLFWLPRAKVAFMAAHETNSIANGALAEGHQRRPHGAEPRAPEGQLRPLRREGLGQPQDPPAGVASTPRSWCPWSTRLTGMAMAVVIVVGGQMVLNGGLDVGVMVAFLFYIQRFFDPIRSLTMQYSVMQRAMASGQRISEVLDVPVTITDKPDAKSLDARHGRLGRVQERHLRLPQEPADPQERQLQGRARRDRRARRPDRLGQIELHVAGPPLLRRLGRRGAGRRPRCARPHPAVARRPDRDGAAGAVPVLRHHPREHPLPQARPRAATTSSAPPRPWAPTTSSWRCPTATTACSASAATT